MTDVRMLDSDLTMTRLTRFCKLSQSAGRRVRHSYFNENTLSVNFVTSLL